MFTSKWAIAGLVIIVVFFMLLVLGRKSVHVDVIISASRDQVWSVLTDFTKTEEWNTVLVPVEGELQEGNSIKYEFYQEEGGKATVMDAKVVQMVPEHLLNQQGGIPLILTFDHQYILKPIDAGTNVIIHEEYRGIMVPFWDPAPVEQAYARLLINLNNRVMINR